MSPESQSGTGASATRVRTGLKHNVKVPLTPPDAFRCSHWLATMAFVRTERSHKGSKWSWLKAKWHGFAKYQWKHEKTKMFGEKVFSLGASAAASGAAFGISTAIGAAVGVAGGPVGIGIGAAVGAVVGAITAAVTITGSLVASHLQHRSSRKQIYDRLTSSKYDYREELDKRVKSDKSNPRGHWHIVVEEGETLDQIVQR
ncbi:MAG: hypothetical protein KKA42_00050, partial [candidate division Zixibacteria bacterium]|nr:hypothetical protein [candidate division Zixibacteria bacterium]